MIKKTSRKKVRKIRHRRIRRKLMGTSRRPRLSVFRSSGHIYVQAIDDTRGHTLEAVNTLQQELKTKIDGKMSPTEVAKIVGKTIAQKLKKQNIEEVVFDRGGYKYHGRIAALADAARQEGLKF